MNSLKPMASSHLFHEFKKCTELQFNGQLKVISSEGKTWTFYYRLGQLVWSTGGTHTSRRLRRNMSQYCPDININKLQILAESGTIDYWDNQIEDIIFLSAEDANVEYWDYRILQNLYKAKKISPKQLKAIVETTISELLFEVAQQVNYTSLRCQRNQDVILNAPLNSTNANMFFKHMEECWQNWVEAGLAIYSPNLAPVIQKPERLKKQVSPDVYKTVEILINGKHSLWDLSVKMKRNVLSITSWLLPLTRQGITKFVEVPDLPLFSAVPQFKRLNTPLVACVDDSSHICQILEEVVTRNGIRFLKIEDPVEALPLLIQNKPDFIFLDLIMPVINGYELCSHLRRSNVFSQTPVVMLTASDGAFDKVRSKLFGATNFINKPIDENTVINIIHQYLSSTSRSTSTSKSMKNLVSINSNSLQPVAV
jgi:chemotaxis family two-component system response regulator PixG